MKPHALKLLNGEIQTLGKVLARNEDFDGFVIQSINKRVPFVPLKYWSERFGVGRVVEVWDRGAGSGTGDLVAGGVSG